MRYPFGCKLRPHIQARICMFYVHVSLQLELAFGGIESKTFAIISIRLEALLAILEAIFASSVVLDSK